MKTCFIFSSDLHFRILFAIGICMALAPSIVLGQEDEPFFQSKDEVIRKVADAFEAYKAQIQAHPKEYRGLLNVSNEHRPEAVAEVTVFDVSEHHEKAVMKMNPPFGRIDDWVTILNIRNPRYYARLLLKGENNYTLQHLEERTDLNLYFERFLTPFKNPIAPTEKELPTIVDVLKSEDFSWDLNDIFAGEDRFTISLRPLKLDGLNRVSFSFRKSDYLVVEHAGEFVTKLDDEETLNFHKTEHVWKASPICDVTMVSETILFTKSSNDEEWRVISRRRIDFHDLPVDFKKEECYLSFYGLDEPEPPTGR